MSKKLENLSSKSRMDLWIVGILTLLTIISYGQIDSRGPSADDFCHAMRTMAFSSQEIVAERLPSSIGSRITLSIVMPFLYKVFSADSITDYHWNYFSLLTLFFHIGNVVIVYYILKLFKLPSIARILVGLIFAIHPIKTRALLWACPALGYVIAFFMFMVLAYVYLRLPKEGQSDRPLLTVSIFILWLIPIFSIEQILPLIPILILVKHTFLTSNKKVLLKECIFFVIITIGYLSVVFMSFSGSTSSKIDHITGGHGLHFDLLHAASSAMMLLYRTVVPSFAYPYDEFVWSQLFSSGFLNATALLTLLSAILFASLLYFVRANGNMVKDVAIFRIDRYIQLIAIGLLITLATLSPLLVTGYSFESRTLYIPMLGISIAAVGFGCWAMRLINQVLDKSSFKGGAVVLAVVFNAAIILFVSFSSLTNTAFQGAYAQAWDIKKRFLLTLEENFPSISSGSEAYIFGLPKKIGPAPVFADPWSLSCVFHATYGQQVEATAIQPVFSMLSDFDIQSHSTLDNIIPIAWCDHTVRPITRIVLQQIQDGDSRNQEVFFRETQRFDQENGLTIKCLVKDIPLNAVISDLYRLTRISVYFIPQIDQVEVQVEVEPIKNSAKRYTLFCHYIYDNDTAPGVSNKTIPSSDLKGSNEKFVFTFKGDNLEALKKIRVGFAHAKSYWKKLQINLPPDQKLLKIKEKAIELKISDLRELPKL